MSPPVEHLPPALPVSILILKLTDCTLLSADPDVSLMSVHCVLSVDELTVVRAYRLPLRYTRATFSMDAAELQAQTRHDGHHRIPIPKHWRWHSGGLARMCRARRVTEHVGDRLEESRAALPQSQTKDGRTRDEY